LAIIVLNKEGYEMKKIMVLFAFLISLVGYHAALFADETIQSDDKSGEEQGQQSLEPHHHHHHHKHDQGGDHWFGHKHDYHAPAGDAGSNTPNGGQAEQYNYQRQNQQNYPIWK
jgi:hypothetical protein